MSDPTPESKIVYVRGIHLYTGDLDIDTEHVWCPNCQQQFEAADDYLAWAKSEPSDEVIGALCPACAERLADQIKLDQTATFVPALQIKPRIVRDRDDKNCVAEQVLLALYGQQHPDVQPQLDLLGVRIDLNDIEPPFESAICAGCGKEFQQEPYATAGAYYGLKRLGNLCPNCLDEGPLHWPMWDEVVEASDSMIGGEKIEYSQDPSLDPSLYVATEITSGG